MFGKKYIKQPSADFNRAFFTAATGTAFYSFYKNIYFPTMQEISHSPFLDYAEKLLPFMLVFSYSSAIVFLACALERKKRDNDGGLLSNGILSILRLTPLSYVCDRKVDNDIKFDAYRDYSKQLDKDIKKSKVKTKKQLKKDRKTYEKILNSLNPNKELLAVSLSVTGTISIIGYIIGAFMVLPKHLAMINGLAFGVTDLISLMAWGGLPMFANYALKQTALGHASDKLTKMGKDTHGLYKSFNYISKFLPHMGMRSIDRKYEISDRLKIQLKQTGLDNALLSVSNDAGYVPKKSLAYLIN